MILAIIRPTEFPSTRLLGSPKPPAATPENMATQKKSIGRKAANASGQLAGLLIAVALVIPAAARAAPPINDDRAAAVELLLGFPGTSNATDATIEPGEGFTPNDASGRRCSNIDGINTTRGVQMDHTVWWGFTGNGGPVTLSTDESPDIDTVMAVYDTTTTPDVAKACNDDLQPQDPGRPFLSGSRVASEVVVDTVAGRHYLVQVGGCAAPSSPLVCYQPTTGAFTLRVSPTPPNDSRATATPIVAGGVASTTNTGATLESGEPASCANSLYAKTIWFRYSAPALGTATFSVAGFPRALNTVLAVYRGDAPLPLGCNDDALADTSGGSSLPAIQPAGALIEVRPGDYYIQVGGYYDAGFTTVAARHGPMNVQVQFSEDTDIDNDGFHRDVDCNDAAAEIHPGAAEIPNNSVDENCDSISARDTDQDGWLAPPAGDDCDDTKPGTHPGAVDVAGNGIDENCDGADAAQPVLNVIFRLDQKASPNRTRIFSLVVVGVPANTTLQITCIGKRCRKASQRRVIKQKHASVALTALLGATLRGQPRKKIFLPLQTRIELRVTKPGFVGRFRSYRIRSRKDPAVQDLCLGPRGKRPC